MTPNSPQPAPQPAASQPPQTGAAPQNVMRFRRYYQSLQPVLQKPKNRVYTALILSFLAISLFAWYAIRPTMQTILYLRREIEDKTQINQKMDEKIASLIEAQATYQSIEDQLPLLAEAVPENSEPIDLALQMKHLADSVSASISGLQVSAVPLLSKEATASGKTTKETEFGVNMVVSGTYGQLKAFLEGIANMRRIVSIDTMTIRSGAEYAAPGEINSLLITIGMKSFYRPK